MRHFLRLPSAIVPLAGGMVQPPPEGPLISPAGAALRLAPLCPGAVFPTVDVPVIARPADLHLAVTPCAVVEAIPWLDHPTPRQPKDWTSGSGSIILELGFHRSLDHRDDP
jgi:hypothetical protein